MSHEESGWNYDSGIGLFAGLHGVWRRQYGVGHTPEFRRLFERGQSAHRYVFAPRWIFLCASLGCRRRTAASPFTRIMFRYTVGRPMLC
jgi:hypothetical protein